MILLDCICPVYDILAYSHFYERSWDLRLWFLLFQRTECIICEFHLLRPLFDCSYIYCYYFYVYFVIKYWCPLLCCIDLLLFGCAFIDRFFWLLPSFSGCYSYWGCGTNTEQKFYVKWIVFHPWTCNVYWLPSNRYVDAAAYDLLAQAFEAKIIYPWVWLRLLTSERIPHTDGSCMAYRL